MPRGEGKPWGDNLHLVDAAVCGRCGFIYAFRGAYQLRAPLPDDCPLPPPLRFSGPLYAMCDECGSEGARWFELVPGTEAQ